jgi:hypothetical protein
LNEYVSYFFPKWRKKLQNNLGSQFSAIFDNFRRKKIGIFLKNQCYDKNFAYFSVVLSQERQFARQKIRRKYLKNHNIGPWHMFYEAQVQYEKLAFSDSRYDYVDKTVLSETLVNRPD